MGLSWDITKCADPDLLQSDRVWPVTNMLIWYTMFTDIGWEVTEANAPEFYARIRVMEKLDGPMLSGMDSDGNRVNRFITPDDVKSIIGLKVNVAPEPRLKWAKGRIVHHPNGGSYMDKFASEYTKATQGEEA